MIENVRRDVLLSTDEKARRRVVLSKRESIVIEDKFVDLYARNSGLRDKLVAERDVVLTYALRALFDAGVMDHLAFKGRTTGGRWSSARPAASLMRHRGRTAAGAARPSCRRRRQGRE